MADRFDVTVVTLRREGIEVFGSELPDVPDLPQIKVIRLHATGSLDRPTKQFYRGLGEIFRDGGFDIIMNEVEPWSVLRWQSWFLAKKFQPEAIFGEFSWENMLRPGLRGLLLKKIYQAAMRSGDFLIAGNTRCAEICTAFGQDPERVEVICQLGVAVSHFEPPESFDRSSARERLGLDPQAFLVGYCGRIIPEKGLLELYEAIEELQTEAALDVHLAIMGNGELSGLPAEHEQKPAWFHRMPARPHDEVGEFMQVLDVFALASKAQIETSGVIWEEQFGRVLIEAAAAGAVVIGSTSGAIPEVIDDREMTVPPGNVSSLTQLIKQLGENTDFYSKKQSCQNERIRAHYAEDVHAAQWEEAFKKFLRLGRKRR